MKKQFRNIFEVPSECRWDLNFLSENKTADVYSNELFNELKNEVNIREHKYDFIKSYLSFLIWQEKIDIKIVITLIYLTNKIDENIMNSKPDELFQKFKLEMSEHKQKMRFEDLRFLKNHKKLSTWVQKANFENFCLSIESKLEEKNIKFQKKILEFKSTIDYSAFEEHIHNKILETLYGSAKRHIHLFKKQRSWHKKLYIIKFKENMTKNGAKVDLIKHLLQKTWIKDAKRIILKKVELFDKELLAIVLKAINKKWIDFMPIDNKSTDAYSVGGKYSFRKQLIPMNFTSDIKSVKKLEDELEHSIYSHFNTIDKVLKSFKKKWWIANLIFITL